MARREMVRLIPTRPASNRGMPPKSACTIYSSVQYVLVLYHCTVVGEQFVRSQQLLFSGMFSTTSTTAVKQSAAACSSSHSTIISGVHRSVVFYQRNTTSPSFFYWKEANPTPMFHEFLTWTPLPVCRTAVSSQRRTFFSCACCCRTVLAAGWDTRR